jgi:hypothetical protein
MTSFWNDRVDDEEKRYEATLALSGTQGCAIRDYSDRWIWPGHFAPMELADADTFPAARDNFLASSWSNGS